MKFSQYDIIEVTPDETSNGDSYTHVMVTFPCKNESTKFMYIVDAIPGNIDGDNNFIAIDGYEVGEPIYTESFIKKCKDLTANRM